MIQYSLGVQLAWEISSYETSNKDSSLIEVDHIMLGVLSLDKIENQLREKSIHEYEQLHFEKEKLYKILYSYKLDPVTLRRKLREMIPKGTGKPQDKIFHRSNNCKLMFNEAAGISNNYITIKHLFVAIISNKYSKIHRLLTDLKIDIEELKTEIMFSFYTQN